MKSIHSVFRAGLILLGAAVLTFLSGAQTSEGLQSGGAQETRAAVDLFGGGAYPGGYLKYTYSITRQGTAQASTTTTEITPLPDGNYSVVSTSTETVSLEMVSIGFFGVPLPRLGIRVPETASGTIDLSPLTNIASTAIEPGRNYLLPDGGRFQAGELGAIADIEVIHGTYTHADYENVEIDLAFPVDLAVRALLPFPAKMEFHYSTTPDATGDQIMRMFSSVELAEFTYEPGESR